MDPFGVPRGEDAAWKSGMRGFVDGQLDDSTGLTHLGAREYDPKLGKFISVDPLVDIKDPQTLNAYAYSNSNPATFSDPDGLMLKGENHGQALPPKERAPRPPAAKSGTNSDNSNVDRRVTHPVEADVQEKVTRHAEAVREVKEELKTVLKDLTKIVADELGITDALDCFKNGDISSCVATGVTVLTSFAGGVAGKLLSKYAAPWKWKRAAELVGNLKGIAEKGVTAIKKLLSLGKCNSFVPGTKVVLVNGSSKAIESVVVGDKVKAAVSSSGLVSAQPVVATIVGNGSKALVKVESIGCCDRRVRRKVDWVCNCYRRPSLLFTSGASMGSRNRSPDRRPTQIGGCECQAPGHVDRAIRCHSTRTRPDSCIAPHLLCCRGRGVGARAQLR
jgi:RHS repeat-associated protein